MSILHRVGYPSKPSPLAHTEVAASTADAHPMDSNAASAKVCRRWPRCLHGLHRSAAMPGTLAESLWRRSVGCSVNCFVKCRHVVPGFAATPAHPQRRAPSTPAIAAPTCQLLTSSILRCHLSVCKMRCGTVSRRIVVDTCVRSTPKHPHSPSSCPTSSCGAFGSAPPPPQLRRCRQLTASAFSGRRDNFNFPLYSSHIPSGRSFYSSTSHGRRLSKTCTEAPALAQSTPPTPTIRKLFAAAKYTTMALKDFEAVLKQKYPAKAHAKRTVDILRKKVPDASGVIYLEAQPTVIRENDDSPVHFRSVFPSILPLTCPP